MRRKVPPYRPRRAQRVEDTAALSTAASVPPESNEVRRGTLMPKMKTKRAAMKRFKKTGTGKLKRWHANHSHILTKKTRKRKNRLKKGDLVSSADFPRVSRLLQA
jgi:large subunit ribosomal protein L35